MILCPYCNKPSKPKFYPDHREGRPNEYYQCNRCGECMYRCNVDNRFVADRATDAQEVGKCYCQDKNKPTSIAKAVQYNISNRSK